MTETTILCFGDSNTHGTKPMPDMNSRERHAKSDRWPTVMADILGPDYEVIAEGHPGRNAACDDPIEGAHKNGLSVLPALLESHRPVDLLIVMLGTNDLKARFSLPAFDIALALERLAVMARERGIASDGTPPKVLFVAPVPIEETGFLAEMFAGGATKSRALPGHLRAIADRQGAAFIDLAGAAQVDPVDGIHLSADSQRALGRAIAAKVQTLIDRTPP